MKNPFKKSSAIDTLVNVGIGGAANVAMDYVFGLLPTDTLAAIAGYKNYIKLGVGILGGTMVSGSAAKYIRPAFDGIATVGASEIVSGLFEAEAKTTNGAPFIAGGKPYFVNKGGGSNGKKIGAVPFQGK